MAAPISITDIEFPSQSQSLSHILSDLRRSTLSITNRLKSVETDSRFVQEVAGHYGLPLVANERCGSWYIPTQHKSGSAYFKSTDGHAGQWDFSLRRLNLQVLDILNEHGGCIIVDSTRRGKSMPDALSKTAPIWAAVMNRTLFPEEIAYRDVQFPPNFLGASEESQIQSRIDGFVDQFKNLQLDLCSLKHRMGKPARIAWATRDYYYPDYSDRNNFHLIVLCSASRRVRGAEMSEGGYIQGAGDDSEGWACGLTPDLFWKHKGILMDSREEDLPEIICDLTEKHRQTPSSEETTLIAPTGNIFVGNRKILDKRTRAVGLIIDCHGDPTVSQNTQFNLGCHTGKIGSRDLRKVLDKIEEFVSINLNKDSSQNLTIVCDTGKDLSVGVALMVLCLFFGENGVYARQKRQEPITKQYIRQRLAWIVSSKHDVNPSRSTLQSINWYLMERRD
ncbi:tRNA A64-2'-O-ribosylphosphate transferase [Ophidiomyces ophidiicola]|uniref:tRNA A64-2'-O-ribosylphosphate transferase n=1 Tax=Ophidiomyces ophidiicola TaxID=1387563 RepID=A0ACB8V5D1_9EURO|nr:tRNA A64-2'-O-ribosylphosphate transferase [Ophidiomyces ophidiicola]KAI1956190.1 tRNA A64-2'-O-ribosylphosphate transferase [Ophidiomyces ophidiicola]KAI1967874.1 tRNA A64-2'-O-ribosylphosphate transferase [Ophidiomyces ophidiicola]KAI1970292.1 tRNA A64-2'-O-ribosylphosphate transferase [Ophidiomyces ophidiicola]KAI2007928.1 tRNA A64-2'-O-ribosylphosphate transferase [Ophidiomyces ophidiicola]